MEHVDLMIMEDRVHSNRYDLPDGFLRDIELIKTNVTQELNARIPSHRDVIAKVTNEKHSNPFLSIGAKTR